MTSERVASVFSTPAEARLFLLGALLFVAGIPSLIFLPELLSWPYSSCFVTPGVLGILLMEVIRLRVQKRQYGTLWSLRGIGKSSEMVYSPNGFRQAWRLAH
jgi:hypothetical protein